MLWHNNARVNSHQRWKQTRNRVCFHLWCELTRTINVTEWQVSWNSFKAVLENGCWTAIHTSWVACRSQVSWLIKSASLCDKLSATYMGWGTCKTPPNPCLTGVCWGHQGVGLPLVLVMMTPLTLLLVTFLMTLHKMLRMMRLVRGTLLMELVTRLKLMWWQ